MTFPQVHIAVTAVVGCVIIVDLFFVFLFCSSKIKCESVKKSTLYFAPSFEMRRLRGDGAAWRGVGETPTGDNFLTGHSALPAQLSRRTVDTFFDDALDCKIAPFSSTCVDFCPPVEPRVDLPRGGTSWLSWVLASGAPGVADFFGITSNEELFLSYTQSQTGIPGDSKAPTLLASD